MSDWELSQNPGDQNNGSDWEVVPQAPIPLQNSASVGNALPGTEKSQSAALDTNPLLSLISGAAQRFNKSFESTRIPTAVGGAVQGAGNLAISGLNLFKDLQGNPNDKKIPQIDLSGQYPQDLLSKAAFYGGDILGSGAGAGLEYKALTKALPELVGNPALIANVLKGAGIGYAGNEQGLGGRTVGGLLGAAAPLANALRPVSTANDIVATKNQLQNYFNKSYGDLFKSATEAGVDKVQRPLIKVGYIVNHVPSKYTESLENFMQNPTPQAAHVAKSDIGKGMGYFDSLVNERNPLTDSQIKARKYLGDAYSKIEGSIHDAFENSSNPGLKQQYESLTKDFKENGVPYLYNNAIDKYERNELKPNNFISKILSNDKFMIAKGNQHPGLKLNEMLNNSLTGKIIKTLAGGALAGTGLEYGIEKYKGANRATGESH